jgi:hypothetical protein
MNCVDSLNVLRESVCVLNGCLRINNCIQLSAQVIVILMHNISVFCCFELFVITSLSIFVGMILHIYKNIFSIQLFYGMIKHAVNTECEVKSRVWISYLSSAHTFIFIDRLLEPCVSEV